MKLLPSLVYSSSVVGINHKNQALGPREVVSPKRSNLVLPAHIPHVELDILIGHGFDVEAHGRDGGNILVQFQLVEDRYLAVSVVQDSRPVWRNLSPAGTKYSLVLPAASRPSMSKRISRDPKILPIILDIWLPILLLWLQMQLGSATEGEFLCGAEVGEMG